MAFNIWKIGLHIQQHEVLAVAIVREASGWYLQRWWRIPLTPQVIVDGHIREPEQLVAALLPWSRELPRRHHIHLSFPANRTLQKKVSSSDNDVTRARANRMVVWFDGA